MRAAKDMFMPVKEAPFKSNQQVTYIGREFAELKHSQALVLADKDGRLAVQFNNTRLRTECTGRAREEFCAVTGKRDSLVMSIGGVRYLTWGYGVHWFDKSDFKPV